VTVVQRSPAATVVTPVAGARTAGESATLTADCPAAMWVAGLMRCSTPVARWWCRPSWCSDGVCSLLPAGQPGRSSLPALRTWLSWLGRFGVPYYFTACRSAETAGGRRTGMAVADDRKQLSELVDDVIGDPVGCRSGGCGWHPWVGLRVCRLYSAA